MVLKRTVKIPNDEDLTWFECEDCGNEVGEDGECFEHSGPCWYCPEDGTCRTCGHGSCDQSC